MTRSTIEIEPRPENVFTLILSYVKVRSYVRQYNIFFSCISINAHAIVKRYNIITEENFLANV